MKNICSVVALSILVVHAVPIAAVYKFTVAANRETGKVEIFRKDGQVIAPAPAPEARPSLYLAGIYSVQRTTRNCAGDHRAFMGQPPFSTAKPPVCGDTMGSSRGLGCVVQGQHLVHLVGLSVRKN